MLCSEETECRFCTNTLPDWRKALEDKPKAAPLMTVSHNGEVHVLQVDQSFLVLLKFFLLPFSFLTEMHSSMHIVIMHPSQYNSPLWGRPPQSSLLSLATASFSAASPELIVLTQVDAGEEGRRAFEHKIRQIFGLRTDVNPPLNEPLTPASSLVPFSSFCPRSFWLWLSHFCDF